MEIDVKPICPEHIEGFHRCLDIVAEETGFLAGSSAPEIESTTTFVLNNIKGNKLQFVATPKNSSNVIGWIDILDRGDESLKNEGVLGMGVLPIFHGNGIGKALMKVAIETAKERGMKRICLEVFEDNSVAIALYKKFAFHEVGRGKLEKTEAGEERKSLFMELVLR